MSATGLGCEGVSVTFGAMQALRDVTLDFEPGRIVSIIGPNGAGKTTFVNVLSGRLPTATGRVILQGRDISRMKPHARARLGIARSFQIISIFSEASVFENLRIAAQRAAFGFQPFWRPAHAYRVLAERVEAALHDAGLEGLADHPAAALSHGDQRALELAMAVVNDPPVILLDEPLAGVGHHEIPEMIARIRKVAAGRTVLLVEHNMAAVMELSDEIVVMVGGAVVAHGPPAEIRANEAVRAAYLGRSNAEA